MIKLGIIGLSEGNGHPYSWAAIINGFDQGAMASCPFPVIPDYLSKHCYPDEFIQGARVTHIWTQDPEISKHVAAASKIDHIVQNPEDMIGAVDGILLARDDYQNHSKFAPAFIKAGLPIYIDKPLANTVDDAQNFLDMQKTPEQIFSCSALRYLKELTPVRKRVQDIQSIRAHTPKSWSLYGIHIIEPVIALLGADHGAQFTVNAHEKQGEAISLKISYKNVDLSFTSSGQADSGISYEIFYKDGTHDTIQPIDVFVAFRSALEGFINQINTQTLSIPREETLTCMRIIERGKA